MISDAQMLGIALAVARWFEFAGMAVIAVGTGVATVKYVLAAAGLRPVREGAEAEPGKPLPAFRRTLGHSILTGLELLVAADIIRTVAVEPTMDSVLVLGIIVLIRTFLSFSLQVEMDGKWPWQKAKDG